MSNIAQKMKSEHVRLYRELSNIIASLPDRIDVDQLVPGTVYKLSSVIRKDGDIVAELDVRININ